MLPIKFSGLSFYHRQQEVYSVWLTIPPKTTAELAAQIALLDPAGLWDDGEDEANRLGTDERTAGMARGRATFRTADRRDIVFEIEVYGL